MNEHLKDMLKRVKLTEIRFLSYVITQSVFQPLKDVNITACKQCHATSHLPQKKHIFVTINTLVS